MSTNISRLLLWAAVPLFPAPLLLVLNAQLTDAFSLRFFVSLGVLAYSWWLLAVLLSTRPRWLDRRIGLPHIYALHGMLGVIAIVAAYFHRDNTFAATRLPRDLGDWAFWGSVAILCYSVLFLSGWLTDRSRVLSTVKRALETVFRHQLSVWIHRLNIVAIIAIWLHVHLIERVSQHLGFMLLFDTYTLVTFAVWAWKKWGAPDDYLRGTLAGHHALNEHVRGLQVQLDKPSQTSRPGDFYFLRFEGPGISREWHPFSATDARNDVLSFTIREHGDFTRTLVKAKSGTPVRLEGPFGRFDRIINEATPSTPLVLIGMGAGVAPLLSIVDGHGATRPIRLLWSVRKRESEYHTDIVNDFHNRFGDRFTFTKQPHRFTAADFDALLTRAELRHCLFVIVGPNNAVLSTRRTLRRLGVNDSRIHDERLTM